MRGRLVLFGALVTGMTVTACGSSSGGRSPVPKSSVQASSATVALSPTHAPSAQPEGSGVETSGIGKGLPVLTPASDSPALKTYSTAQVTDAMEVARKLAYLSVSDTTLLDGRKHTLASYGSEHLLLTPSAWGSFAAAFKRCQTVLSACAPVTSLAAAITPGGGQVVVDTPVTPVPQVYTPRRVVALSSSANGSPAMVVQGQVSSGVEATYKGKHGKFTIARGFSYRLKVTGNPTAPVLVDGWSSTYKTNFIAD